MQTSRRLKGAVIAVAMTAMVPAPARADEVLCDGNVICLAVAVPVLLAHLAFVELTKTTPPYDLGLRYIRDGKTSRLQDLLRDNPALVADAAKLSALLSTAAAAGNLAATQALVKAGALPHYNRSAVLATATSPEVMAYLIASGATPNDVDLSLYRSNLAHPRLAELLGALLDARGTLAPNDGGALSLLDDAARHRRGDIVKLLLQRGVNPNGGAQSVLLTLSSSCPNPAPVCRESAVGIARDLIASGAEVKVFDGHGRSAVDLAKRLEYLELAKVIEEAGG